VCIYICEKPLPPPRRGISAFLEGRIKTRGRGKKEKMWKRKKKDLTESAGKW
jgi:hypothetical protein